MIKINGRPDTEEIARMIVIKTINESMVKYYGTRISNDELKELTEYVKEQLEEIIKEVEPKQRAFRIFCELLTKMGLGSRINRGFPEGYCRNGVSPM